MTKGGSVALEVKDVVISYAKKNAVIDHLNLEIQAGETFGLIGLNGVGKTTLIKSILGLN